jgi:hypothetical protein
MARTPRYYAIFGREEMRGQSWFLGLALSLAAGLATLSAAPAPGTADRIARLVEQLGSPKYDEREKASADLEAIGEPALEALRKAARMDDAEVKRRAAELVGRIERKVESTQVLSPKKIHLVFKNTPLPEAVAEIKKQCGYDVVLQDPQNKLQERTVTLDTGETSFWHALHLFCQKASLVEASAHDFRPVPPPGPRLRGAGPVAPAAPAPGVPAVPAPAAKRMVRASALAVEAAQAPPPPKPVAPAGAVAAPARATGASYAYQPYSPSRITLIDGKADSCPTDDSTAIRIRALRNPGVAGRNIEGEIWVWLEATPEPRLHWQGLSAARVEKAVDDQGQKLTEIADTRPGVRGAGPALAGLGRMNGIGPYASGLGQRTFIRLKKGDKEAKSLKELSGVLTAHVLTDSRPFITVENILGSSDKTVKGKDGGSLKVLDVKTEKEKITIRVEVEPPPDVVVETLYSARVRPGPAMMLRAMPAVPVLPAGPAGAIPPAAIAPPAPPGGGLAGVAVGMSGTNDPYSGLTLRDEKGKILPAQFQVSVKFVPGGAPTREFTLAYQIGKDQEKPAKLVFSGRKNVEVEIPFALKDVPLP